MNSAPPRHRLQTHLRRCEQNNQPKTVVLCWCHTRGRTTPSCGSYKMVSDGGRVSKRLRASMYLEKKKERTIGGSTCFNTPKSVSSTPTYARPSSTQTTRQTDAKIALLSFALRGHRNATRACAKNHSQQRQGTTHKPLALHELGGRCGGGHLSEQGRGAAVGERDARPQTREGEDGLHHFLLRL